MRIAALGLATLLLFATLLVLVISLRLTAEVRQRLLAVDEEVARLARRSSADTAGIAAGLEDLSARLSDLSRATRGDLGSVRTSTRADLSRLRDGLTDRLDEVARRVTDLADQRAAAVRTEPAVIDRETVEETRPSAGLSPVAAPGDASIPSDREPRDRPAPDERDLSLARQDAQATAWFASGQYERARFAFARLLAERPQDPAIQLYYAVSLYRSNPSDSSRYAQVEKRLRAILAAEPGSVLALDTLAALDVERGRWPEALDKMRQLAALQPADPRYARMAGFCARRTGDFGSARDFYAAAANLSPGDVEALAALGDCQWALGNKAEASRSWEAALATVDPATAVGARAGALLRDKIARAASEGGAE